MRAEYGDTYLLDLLDAYMGRICVSEKNMRHWLRMFQELNAHSVFHLLPSIESTHPVLIISGFWDMITPPMQSVELARRIPHSVHYCDPFSSHASICESPESCVAEISCFLENALGKKKKKGKGTKKKKKGKK